MKTNSKTLRFRLGHRLPMILQDEHAECGHACVAMIANYWGHRLDLNALRHIHRPSVRGITLKGITQLFEQLGFTTRALRVSLNEMHLIKLPAVIHWNMNHFVVLKKVTRTKIIIHDPAVGVRVCSMAEANQSFTGIVLEVEPSHPFQCIRPESKITLTSLVRTIIGMPKILGILLILSLLIESMRTMNPLFMQYVTDHVLGSHDMNQMHAIGMGFTFFILLQGMVEYTRSHLVLYTTMHIAESFTKNTFKHLLRLPLSFFESRHLGDIQSKFQSIEQIKSKLSTDVVYTLLDGMMMVVTLSLMFVYSWVLSTIVLVAMLIYLCVRYISFKRYKEQQASAIVLHAKTASGFLETIQSMMAIKCNVKENLRFHLWHNDYIDALNHDIQVSRLQIRYQLCQQIFAQLEHVIVVCIGVRMVCSKQLTIGMLFAFLAYRLMLINKAASFIQHFFDYQLISLQLNRLGDLIHQVPEEQQTEKEMKLSDQASLTLKDVSFQYRGQDKVIFSHLNFEIHSGEKTAIIGPSGCGKSSLLKVIMGLERHSEGDILVNGISLDLFGLQNFRQISASVMQEDTLFTGSVLDNITFFSDDIDIEKVHRVAQLAYIHHAIMSMPMGYDTLIGHMGSTLSGGQKQRLLLARALYKEPKFLFLDEATSHLDSVAEQHINQSLKTLGMTQIIVAHREESIRMADRIIDLSYDYTENKQCD